MCRRSPGECAVFGVLPLLYRWLSQGSRGSDQVLLVYSFDVSHALFEGMRPPVNSSGPDRQAQGYGRFERVDSPDAI